MTIDLSRRGLILGAAATLFAASAPAIVRPGLVMPIKSRLVPPPAPRRAWMVTRAECDIVPIPDSPVARAAGRVMLSEVLSTDPIAGSPGFAIWPPHVLDRDRVIAAVVTRNHEVLHGWRGSVYTETRPATAELTVDAAYAAGMQCGQIVEMD